MSEPTKEQVEKWRSEFENDCHVTANLETNEIGEYISEEIELLWVGYLAAKKSNFEETEELKRKYDELLKDYNELRDYR